MKNNITFLLCRTCTENKIRHREDLHSAADRMPDPYYIIGNIGITDLMNIMCRIGSAPHITYIAYSAQT